MSKTKPKYIKETVTIASDVSIASFVPSMVRDGYTFHKMVRKSNKCVITFVRVQ